MATSPSDDRAASAEAKSPPPLAPTGALEADVLSPVDRISEMLFGLLMALTFTGAVSVAESGNAEIRTMFIAALGCNLAWGLVDAVMHLVRTVTERGRLITLVRAVQGRTATSKRVARWSSSRCRAWRRAWSRRRRSRPFVAASSPCRRCRQGRTSAGVTSWWRFRSSSSSSSSTFPVVLPFLLMQDVTMAKNVSRAIALAMLFLGGLGLGRYAGYGSWRVGLIMAGLGTALIVAINALGG